MSDRTHNDPLLSAFLDGELSPEQREQMEKRIGENQGLRHLLQQWKDQGDAVRALPRMALRNDLSARVLAEISRRQASGSLTTAISVDQRSSSADQIDRRTSKPSKPPSFVARHRILVAVASLAGVLLIGVFLFGPKSSSNFVAKNAADQSDPVSLQESASWEEELSRSQPSGLGQAELSSSGGGVGHRLDLEDREPEGKDNSNGASANPAMSDLGMSNSQLRQPADDRNELADSAFALDSAHHANAAQKSPMVGHSKKNNEPIDSALGGAMAEPEKFKKLDELTAGGAAVALKIEADRAMADSLEPPSEKAPTGSHGAGSSLDTLAAEEGREFAFSEFGPAISLPQVYFLEFPSDDRPLATISEILSRNQIEIQSTDSAKETDNQGPSNALNRLAAQSNHGLEAIYVIATRDQLSRAMNELSNQANISGYEISSKMLEKMLSPRGNSTASAEPSMDQLIAQANSKSASALMKSKVDSEDSKNETPEPSQVEPPESRLKGPQRPIAMAQQLHPVERNQRAWSFEAGQPSEPNRPASASGQAESDPLDRMMRSSTMHLFWRRPIEAGDSPAGDGRLGGLGLDGVAKEDAAKDDAAKEDGELVQFLLLIRTPDTSK
jgi:negative regulator of sigma E activity